MGAPPSDFSVRPGQFAEAASILTEAAQWLIDSGQQLWPLDEVDEAALRARCSDPANVLVGYLGRQAVVTALLEWRDDMFWPGVRDAGFIHRLAVRRNAAGQGHATALLDWAAEEAARRGKSTLRLDCMADRPRLCAFYERCGFERVGTFVREPHYNNALYSRPLRRT
ncbi:MAG: GNAT family N-acetyltransferase [Dehalococcoidia bacterium]